MQTEDNDPLSSEISLEVQLDEKGVKAGAKSRFMVALDRLCGSLVDVPGAYVEGVSRRKRLRNQIREELMRAEGEAAIELKRADPAAGRAALDHFADDLSRKQINKEAIVLHAIEDMREHPGEDTAESDEQPLDDDWLNLFGNHAENASSDHLRRMWGKVLAGEIRKPGSFSLSTLRFISEIDREIATKFQEAVQHRFMGGFIARNDDIKGSQLIDLVFLEEIGLLQQVAGIGGLQISHKFDESGQYLFRHGKLLLIATGLANQDISIPVIKITRTGREIATILPLAPDLEVLRSIAAKLSTATTVEIAIITSETAGRVSYMTVEKVK